MSFISRQDEYLMCPRLQRELEEARVDLEEYRKRYYAVQDSVTELQKALDTEVIFCRAERERAERAEADSRIIEEENNGFRETIATLTQERDAALAAVKSFVEQYENEV